MFSSFYEEFSRYLDLKIFFSFWEYYSYQEISLFFVLVPEYFSYFKHNVVIQRLVFLHFIFSKSGFLIQIIFLPFTFHFFFQSSDNDYYYYYYYYCYDYYYHYHHHYWGGIQLLCSHKITKIWIVHKFCLWC